MPALHEWSRHADAIEDARTLATPTLILAALRWLADHPHDDATQELVEALDLLFSSRGYVGGVNANRALEIVLDAYLCQRPDLTGGRHDTAHPQPV